MISVRSKNAVNNADQHMAHGTDEAALNITVILPSNMHSDFKQAVIAAARRLPQ
jgi:hypothetical protein